MISIARSLSGLCCIDVGHCVRAGTDVVEAIQQVGPRLFNLHMKDLTDFHAKDSQVAVGEGKMPVRQIFQALIETHYKGFVDLEYEVHADDHAGSDQQLCVYARGAGWDGLSRLSLSAIVIYCGQT